jgi:hypothetical protein
MPGTTGPSGQQLEVAVVPAPGSRPEEVNTAIGYEHSEKETLVMTSHLDLFLHRARG